MKLGILGGGQLGMMMCQAAKNIDISTVFTQTVLTHQLLIFLKNTLLISMIIFLK